MVLLGLIPLLPLSRMLSRAAIQFPYYLASPDFERLRIRRSLWLSARPHDVERTVLSASQDGAGCDAMLART